LLVAFKVKIAVSGPEKGSPDTPENEKFTEPDAETVVVVPDVEMLHCCTDPSCCTYCANVTGNATAVPAVRTTIVHAAAKQEAALRLLR